MLFRSRSEELSSLSVEGVVSAVAACLPARSAPSPLPADHPSVPVTPALLEVRNLSFRFDSPSSETPLILDGVDALFPRGAWTAVVGRTGSGKSTLVQHLNGLYKVQSGRILPDFHIYLLKFELLCVLAFQYIFQ